MSTKVATAPAHQAKQPVRSEKPAETSEKQQAVQDEDVRLADDDSEADVRVADEVATGQEAPLETSLAGDFTFGEALAEAAADSGSLITEAEETKASVYSNYGGGSSEGTILLVGAIILVGLGIAALASGGDGDGDNDVPLNQDPTLTLSAATLTVDEDSAGGSVTVTTADPDGDTVAVSATAPNGEVTVANGTITYVPDADFSGTDTITVTGNDGNGGTVTKTVAVTVTGINDAPVFADDAVAISTDENTAFTGDLSGLASDVDGDDLTFGLETQAANGVVVVNADGTYTYTPNTNFSGSDSYVVNVSDGEFEDTLLVNVTVVDDGMGPPTETESIDVGTTSNVINFDAGDADVTYTDDTSVVTNVFISDFGEGDMIAVTGATADQYSFGTDGDNLEVIRSNGDDFNKILIALEDPLTIDGIVFDYGSAVDALGFEFMTFTA